MKQFAKNCLRGLFLALAFPLGVFAGFGRWASTYTIAAHLVALIPGLIGDYYRIAFYKLTLTSCSLESRISFGSIFAHPNASIGREVYVGIYCVLGCCVIGDRTQIASHVQVLSGRRQHARDASGRIAGSDEEQFEVVDIGADCWIGAGAIVMAPIGSGTTIGAGAVVVSPVESQVVAVGNPARVIREAVPAAHT